MALKIELEALVGGYMLSWHQNNNNDDDYYDGEMQREVFTNTIELIARVQDLIPSPLPRRSPAVTPPIPASDADDDIE